MQAYIYSVGAALRHGMACAPLPPVLLVEAGRVTHAPRGFAVKPEVEGDLRKWKHNFKQTSAGAVG